MVVAAAALLKHALSTLILVIHSLQLSKNQQVVLAFLS